MNKVLNKDEAVAIGHFDNYIKYNENVITQLNLSEDERARHEKEIKLIFNDVRKEKIKWAKNRFLDQQSNNPHLAENKTTDIKERCLKCIKRIPEDLRKQLEEFIEKQETLSNEEIITRKYELYKEWLRDLEAKSCKDIPKEKLYCHFCVKHFGDLDSFVDHYLEDETHKTVINAVKGFYEKKANFLREILKAAESIVLNGERCEMCEISVADLNSHRRSDAHLNLKKFLHPSPCLDCKTSLNFSCPDDYNLHLLSPNHLKNCKDLPQTHELEIPLKELFEKHLKLSDELIKIKNMRAIANDCQEPNLKKIKLN